MRPEWEQFSHNVPLEAANPGWDAYHSLDLRHQLPGDTPKQCVTHREWDSIQPDPDRGDRCVQKRSRTRIAEKPQGNTRLPSCGRSLKVRLNDPVCARDRATVGARVSKRLPKPSWFRSPL
jgi:hypothetical protein